MSEKNNVSSGAEKAEKLTRKNTKAKPEGEEIKNLADNSDGNKKNTVGAKKSTAHKSGAKNKSVKDTKKQKSAQKEEKREKKKELAAERKQKRLERKLAHKEKREERNAQLKEKKLERREEKRKRRDMLKSESREQKAKRIEKERAQKLADKKQKREQKLEAKQQKREHALKRRQQKRLEKLEKRQSKERTRTPGFGGWLAAVISLGVTTLALGTVLTFGWITMDGMQADMAVTYTESLYELNSIVDELDTDLAKAKASSSASDRVRVLTEIATESESAETVLERFPLEIQVTERLTSFINEMGGAARGMLYTVADGGELNERQLEQLNYLYETNAKVKSELNSLMEKTSEKDMLSAMLGKDSSLTEAFTAIQNNVFETEEAPGANSRRLPPQPALLEGADEITASDAEKLAKQYFSDYDVTDAVCTGEAMGIIPVYNVNLTTADGEMTAQLTKAGGKLLSFDSFKDCDTENFSVDRCVDIAEEFLQKVGYTNLKAAWASEFGTTCNIHFATEQDGVIVYSDLIKVKVCEQRGIVTGLEATGYVMRHSDREIGSAAITAEEAKSAVNGNIEISSERLALIPQGHEEIFCYEFFGEMDGVEYYVYVNAETGEEVEVKTVVGTAQGKLIK